MSIARRSVGPRGGDTGALKEAPLLAVVAAGAAEMGVGEGGEAEGEAEGAGAGRVSSRARKANAGDAARASMLPEWMGKASLMTLGGAGAFGSGFQLDSAASTAEAIAVLASIIFVHECGHFFAARLQNIHVSKFSVGFGPNLLSYQVHPTRCALNPAPHVLHPTRHTLHPAPSPLTLCAPRLEQGPEVEYSLRAIPLGGFVAFPDDDPDCPYPEDDPDLLRNRPMKDRAIVIGAGVTANVLFALAILFTQVNTVGFSQQDYQPGVKVGVGGCPGASCVSASCASANSALAGVLVLCCSCWCWVPSRRVCADKATHWKRSRALVALTSTSPPFVALSPKLFMLRMWASGFGL